MQADQQRVLHQAAMDELLCRGIDGMTAEHIAERAGVDPSVIVEVWGDWRTLFLDAALTDARKRFPPPDTGSLRGDLVACTTGLAKVPERGWFRRMLATNQDVDFSEIRDDYWTVRAHDFAPIFQRGIERGEVRDDIDPVEACRMFTTACLYDVIFTGNPVRDDYTAALIDIFIRGVAPSD